MQPSTELLRRRRPVGVTLLELLIVLAVLLALMAIAMPFTLRSLEARELESTEESIASELIKARVKAQESGRAVEVVVEETPPRVIVRYFRQDEFRRQDEFGFAGAGEGDRFESPEGSSANSSYGVEQSREGWSEESALHSSVSLTDAGKGDAADEREPTGAASAAKERNPVRLAVYMPDGTTLFAATLLLMHQNGLKSRISVDPWTGQPAIKRGASGGAEAPPDDELAPDEGFDDLDAESSERPSSEERFDEPADDSLDGVDAEASR